MKAREALTECVRRIVAQGEPGVAGSGCTYANDSGHRCAVGVMLPDAVIEQILDYGVGNEGVQELLEPERRNLRPTADDIATGAWSALEIEDGDTIAFWTDVQACHDGAAIEYRDADFYSRLPSEKFEHHGSAFVARFLDNVNEFARERGWFDWRAPT